MSEEKRTIDQIHQLYSQVCTKAGHLAYQIKIMSEDLELVQAQLKSLNQEAARLAAEQAAPGEGVKSE